MSQRFMKYLLVFMQLYLLIYEDECIHFYLTWYLLTYQVIIISHYVKIVLFLIRDNVLFIPLHCEEEINVNKGKKKLMM